MTQSPLEPRTQYEVRVRAKNGENDATEENWSSIGRGTTGPSNRRPEFDSDAAVVELRVDENTRSGQPVGSAVSASDAGQQQPEVQPRRPGGRLVHHRIFLRPDTDEVAPRLRDEARATR